MKIRSLSNILYFPLFIGALAIFYFAYEARGNAFIWVFLPIICMVAIYVGQAQIDYWWMQKFPVPLDDRIKTWLQNNGSFYLSLSQAQQLEYENRLSNYLFAREFLVVGRTEQRDLPEDIKAIIASQAINLTFGQDDFLLDDYDRIFIYTHPFPSPQFQFLHSVEVEFTDKVIILAMDQAVRGVVNPRQHYNIALHAYADAFLHTHPTKEFPEVHHLAWAPITAILGLDKETILQTCGFEVVNLQAVHIVAYMTDKETYLKLAPIEGHEFERILRL